MGLICRFWGRDLLLNMAGLGLARPLTPTLSRRERESVQSLG